MAQVDSHPRAVIPLGVRVAALKSVFEHVDWTTKAMQMLGGSKSTAALPQGTVSPTAAPATPTDTVKAPMSAQDAELEALRKQIDSL